ncbi:hypothetical protein NDK47_14180 [Brevibacillus ruminantium]|uniref:DUF4149 domain-containing protein n=1 Tax=Brevibacillus ruminantium TaxID=2950604 RepID=A0ABY4WDH7_9BACL|nr:hypothetical protein [Brevibacillus ruminantium]USG63334.1 hypothetical protein NDK47_14180 [Brevibacillus ruminantium]
MLEWTMRVLEILCYGLIIGGGVIMAVCVRPLLLPLLSSDKTPDVVSLIEGISIQAWNRYNRYAFYSSLVLLLLNVIYFLSAAAPSSLFHVAIMLLVVLGFARKFSIDRQLRTRLEENAHAAVGSIEQIAGHRQVELLSKIILILTLIALIFPK